ncbi:unnamed protein product [Chrysoparadoxa australica]
MRKWVPHWLHLFKKLSLDEDRRVREAASATLEAFIRQAKREFAPHLGELMGPWWCLMGDSASEVAASGQRAFEASFPPRRRPDLLAMCADSMVEYLSSCAQLTLEGFSAKVGCSTEEVEERSEKAVVAAMNGLSRLLSALREEDNKALAVPGGRYSRAMDSSMWRHLQASQPALRRAAYNLLSACCQAVPSFLEEGPQKQVQELAEVVFGALGEPEPANHAAMWSAVTVFVQAYPAAWEHMDVSRSVLPKLFKQLRQGQYLQSASASYPSLLPLLAHIPEGSIRGFSGKLGKGKVGFCKQLLGAVWQGLRAEVEKQGRGISACEATLLVTAQLECAVYLLLSLREEEEQSSAVAEALAGHILLVYEAVLEVPGYSGVEVADKFVTSADREGLARCLGAALVQLDKDRPMVVGSNVWGGLNGVIEAVVEGRMAGSVQLLGAVLESAARSAREKLKQKGQQGAAGLALSVSLSSTMQKVFDKCLSECSALALPQDADGSLYHLMTCVARAAGPSNVVARPMDEFFQRTLLPWFDALTDSGRGSLACQRLCSLLECFMGDAGELAACCVEHLTASALAKGLPFTSLAMRVCSNGGCHGSLDARIDLLVADVVQLFKNCSDSGDKGSAEEAAEFICACFGVWGEEWVPHSYITSETALKVVGAACSLGHQGLLASLLHVLAVAGADAPSELLEASPKLLLSKLRATSSPPHRRLSDEDAAVFRGFSPVGRAWFAEQAGSFCQEVLEAGEGGADAGAVACAVISLHGLQLQPDETGCMGGLMDREVWQRCRKGSSCAGPNRAKWSVMWRCMHEVLLLARGVLPADDGLLQEVMLAGVMLETLAQEPPAAAEGGALDLPTAALQGSPSSSPVDLLSLESVDVLEEGRFPSVQRDTCREVLRLVDPSPSSLISCLQFMVQGICEEVSGGVWQLLCRCELLHAVCEAQLSSLPKPVLPRACYERMWSRAGLWAESAEEAAEFRPGDEVLYRVGGGAEVQLDEAKVVGVHRDANEPVFYTVQLRDGRERQTLQERLCRIPAANRGTDGDGDGDECTPASSVVGVLREVLEGSVLPLEQQLFAELRGREGPEGDLSDSASALLAALSCVMPLCLRGVLLGDGKGKGEEAGLQQLLRACRQVVARWGAWAAESQTTAAFGVVMRVLLACFSGTPLVFSSIVLDSIGSIEGIGGIGGIGVSSFCMRWLGELCIALPTRENFSQAQAAAGSLEAVLARLDPQQVGSNPSVDEALSRAALAWLMRTDWKEAAAAAAAASGTVARIAEWAANGLLVYHRKLRETTEQPGGYLACVTKGLCCRCASVLSYAAHPERFGGQACWSEISRSHGEELLGLMRTEGLPVQQMVAYQVLSAAAWAGPVKVVPVAEAEAGAEAEPSGDEAGVKEGHGVLWERLVEEGRVTGAGAESEADGDEEELAELRQDISMVEREYPAELLDYLEAYSNGAAGGSTQSQSQYTHLLTWLLFLDHLSAKVAATSCTSTLRPATSSYVALTQGLAPALAICFASLPSTCSGRIRRLWLQLGLATGDLDKLHGAVLVCDPEQPREDGSCSYEDEEESPPAEHRVLLSLYVFYRLMYAFPALVRRWWTDDCPKSLRGWAGELTQAYVSPTILKQEVASITAATSRNLWGEDMTVRASSRCITASYIKDECVLEVCLDLPPSYPLRNVAVQCSRRLGIPESRWRRWVLQIVKLLSMQDGSVLGAVHLWQANVDREFEGVEPCIICYSVLHPKTMHMPSLSCSTCHNKYHSSCLYKWFHTSRKSRCPMCVTPWNAENVKQSR